MRRSATVVVVLLALLVSIPPLRHASAPEFSRTSETTLHHAPRSAPSIARSAATVAVTGVEVPPSIFVVVVAAPAEPQAATTRPASRPHVPLRL
jgi:hypothetical protein